MATGLPCILSASKRQVSAVGGLSVNSGRRELQSIVVSKLKTEDGQTVGLVVRDFCKGFAGPRDCKGIQVKVYSSSVRFLFRVESPYVLALFRKDSPEHGSSHSSERACLRRVRLNPWLSIKWNWKDASSLRDMSQDGCGQMKGQRHSRRWSLT